jgi:hypothetical protein
MANLELKTRIRNVSRRGKRFLTKLDMAIFKKDQATQNAEIKRGELEAKANRTVVPCQCGSEGCLMHRMHDNLPFG